MKMFQTNSSLFIILVTIASGFVVKAGEPNCSKAAYIGLLQPCCAQNSILTDESILQACGRPPKEGVGITACFSECMFNRSGILYNGQIQLEKAKSFFIEKFKNSPEMFPILEESVTKCDKISNVKISSVTGIGICNSLPMIFTRCMMIESFINCPESNWVNSEVCNNAKDFFKLCPIPNQP